ncbi:MAG: hypothetical protein BGO29_01230 [Bacteroidales bacterium 36-12]|nr:MAG: hypothetical protein BGO29_01230 [Bacteroidales bacterium 36-12]
MKGKNLYLLFLLTCFTLISCNKRNSNEVFQGAISCENIKIDILKDDLFPVDFIQNCKVVRLETNESSLIGEMKKIIVTSDRIFIMDSDVTQSLFVFDREGKYIMKIGTRGNGPGEYYSVNDFFVDENKQQISIYDGNVRKVFYYDWYGKYLKVHHFKEIWMNACYPLDSTCFALDFTRTALGRNKFHLQLSTTENQMYYYYKPLKYNYQYTNNTNIAFYKGIETVFYVPVRCDTIFCISTTGIDKGYAIDFGEQTLPSNFQDRYKGMEQADVLLNSNYCYGIKNVLETDGLLCFTFKYGMMSVLCIYEKATRKIYIRLPYLPVPITSYENYLIGYGESHVYQEIKHAGQEVIKEYKNAFGEEVFDMVTNIDANENPIIFFMKRT